MSLELEGWNWEGYPHFQLTIDGYTCLTGEGNEGKSAIARALSALLMNDFHPRRIRRGAKECVLKLRFVDEKHDVMQIERRKTARANTYEITMRDGSVRSYSKAGVEIPKELEEIGFGVLRTEDGGVHNLNFHRQFAGDTLFLLQLSEPQLAAFINKVFRLDREEAALRRMNADSADIRKRYDKRSKEITKVQAALDQASAERDEAAARHASLQAAIVAADAAAEALARIDRGLASLQLAQQRREEARQAEAAEQKSRRLRHALERLRAAVEQRGRVESTLTRVSTLREQRAEAVTALQQVSRLRPRVLQVCDQLSLSLRLGRKLTAHRAALVRREQAITDLTRIGQMAPCVQQLQVAIVRANRVRALADRRQAVSRSLQQAETQIAASRSLAERVRRLQSCLTELQRVRVRRHEAKLAAARVAQAGDSLRQVRALREGLLPLASSLSTAIATTEAVEKLTGASRKANQAEARLKEITASLRQARAKRDQVRNLLGQCPTCGGSLQSHIHEGAHAA